MPDDKRQAYEAIAKCSRVEWKAVVEAAKRFLPEAERTAEILLLIDSEVSRGHPWEISTILALVPEPERTAKAKELVRNPKLDGYLKGIIDLMSEAEKLSESGRLFESCLSHGSLPAAREIGKTIGRDLAVPEILYAIERSRLGHYGDLDLAQKMDFLPEPQRTQELETLLAGMLTNSSPVNILSVAKLAGHELSQPEKETILEGCLSHSMFEWAREAAKLLDRELTVSELERIFEGQLGNENYLDYAIVVAKVLPEPNRTVCLERVLAVSLRVKTYLNEAQKVAGLIGRKLTRSELTAFLKRLSVGGTYDDGSVKSAVAQLLSATDD
jgi:hypothetical protein